jgi:hypothetical protein
MQLRLAATANHGSQSLSITTDPIFRQGTLEKPGSPDSHPAPLCIIALATSRRRYLMGRLSALLLAQQCGPARELLSQGTSRMLATAALEGTLTWPGFRS